MATIKTIAKDGTPSDYTSLTAAVAAEVTGKTITDDLTLQFIDATPQVYSEKVILTGCTISVGKLLTILGKFDRASRTTMRHDDPGALLVIASDRIHIKGIAFDRTEAIDDRREGIHITNAKETSISHCHFLGNGYYKQDGIRILSNQPGELNIWNNLFRRWGQAAISFEVRSKIGDAVKIWNNTFIKSQECIQLKDAEGGLVEVWNNIFDMDGDWLLECTSFFAIKCGSFIPTSFLRLDYNLYHFRTTVGMLLFYGGFGSEVYPDLASMKAAHPSVEVHGVQADPRFDTYCSDYHIGSSVSPALGSDPLTTPVDDNDDVIRVPDFYRGCYDQSASTEFNLKASPQMDLKQNSTFWLELEDTRSSGNERPIRVDLDYVRLK